MFITAILLVKDGSLYILMDAPRLTKWYLEFKAMSQFVIVVDLEQCTQSAIATAHTPWWNWNA